MCESKKMKKANKRSNISKKGMKNQMNVNNVNKEKIRNKERDQMSEDEKNLRSK